MCGRLNIAEPQKLSNLLAEFAIDSSPDEFFAGRFIRATNMVSVLTHTDGHIGLQPATWWLLLEPNEITFKPSKYTSFNTRYDKLNIPRSAGFQAYRKSRCIIPVNGFGETEFKDRKAQHYHDMVGLDKPLLMGGLTRVWRHPKTGQTARSCSVITVPPHHKLQHIHSKSMPLIMPHDKDLISNWLNPELQNTE
ncbi:MAG: DUF159 family protein, partial [Enterobacterales bacterium]|nr:DUF159 family protein [Enterobacterales bacterium]